MLISIPFLIVLMTFCNGDFKLPLTNFTINNSLFNETYYSCKTLRSDFGCCSCMADCVRHGTCCIHHDCLWYRLWYIHGHYGGNYCGLLNADCKKTGCFHMCSSCCRRKFHRWSRSCFHNL